MKRTMAMALGLIPGLAQAALPPCAYEDMIAEAELVIQVQVAQVLPPDDNGTCMVDGTIVRAFRGPLETGGPVRVRVPCDNPDGMVGARCVLVARQFAFHPVHRSAWRHRSGDCRARGRAVPD